MPVTWSSFGRQSERGETPSISGGPGHFLTKMVERFHPQAIYGDPPGAISS